MAVLRPTRDDDLVRDDIIADPHPYFAEIRAEAPVHWNAHHRMWVLTRYDDCAAALRSDALASDTFTPFFTRLSPELRRRWEPLHQVLSSWLSFMDPPAHTRIRRLVGMAFTPAVVRGFRDDATRIACELLDDAARGGRSFDLVGDFAYPLPANVIAGMLGVRDEDLLQFREWGREITLVSLGGDEPDRFDRAQAAIVEFADYLRRLLDDRRGQPPGQDVLSALQGVDDADKLSDEEIIATGILLLIAGHETTQNLIANMVIALSTNPDVLETVRRDPERHAQVAVEETLRFDGPVKGRIRQATRRWAVGTHHVEPGEKVFVAMAAANRDASHFENPDAFDVTRPRAKHLAFGTGIHHCLGAPLARMEAEIALRQLMERLPSWDIDAAGVAYDRKLIVRSPRELTAPAPELKLAGAAATSKSPRT